MDGPLIGNEGDRSDIHSVLIRFLSSFLSEMTGLLVAWLSTTPPYFSTRLYWSAVTL